jgi:hypothetical protein
MWRLVKPWKGSDEPLQQAPARLSDWGAMTYTEDGETLVVALEVQTYLTVVFEYTEGEVFQQRFSSALAAALDDLGVEPSSVRDEVSAAGPVCLSRLTDARLREALKMAAYICGVERLDHDDLRIVQKNLNNFPHDLPPDHVPLKAVRHLFSRPASRPA